jgi:hypothetical protein
VCVCMNSHATSCGRAAPLTALAQLARIARFAGPYRARIARPVSLASQRPGWIRYATQRYATLRNAAMPPAIPPYKISFPTCINVCGGGRGLLGKHPHDPAPSLPRPLLANVAHQRPSSAPAPHHQTPQGICCAPPPPHTHHQTPRRPDAAQEDPRARPNPGPSKAPAHGPARGPSARTSCRRSVMRGRGRRGEKGRRTPRARQPERPEQPQATPPPPTSPAHVCPMCPRVPCAEIGTNKKPAEC